MKSFLSGLKELFFEEGIRILHGIGDDLGRLSVSPGDRSAIERVYREIYILKGDALIYGLGEMNEICRKLERIFGKIRRGEIQANGELISLVAECGGFLVKYLVGKGELNDRQKEIFNVLDKKLLKFEKQLVRSGQKTTGKEGLKRVFRRNQGTQTAGRLL